MIFELTSKWINEIHEKLVQLVATKGKILVAGKGVYRLKVAREVGLLHIPALVREEDERNIDE